jgi:hypothetical protein
MRNKFVRLSFVAQAGLNFSPAGGVLNAQLVIGTGAPAKNVVGYTNQTVPLSIAVPLTATPTRFQVNATVVVPANTTQAEVAFFTIPVGTAGADDSYYVDDVQLEVVPAATGYVSSDFERLNFQEQLLLCQRHFYKTFSYYLAPVQAIGSGGGEHMFNQAGAASTAQNMGHLRFPVSIRATPSTILYNPLHASAQIINGSNGNDWTASSVSGLTPQGLFLTGTSPAASAVGVISGVHLIADAGI